MITKKEILFELIWVVGICLLAILLSVFLVNNFPLEINIHDTYIVVSNWSFFFVCFLFILGFLIYIIKEGVNKYKKILGNILILFFSGALLVLVEAIAGWFIPYFGVLIGSSGIGSGGWTVYPPLSAHEVYMSQPPIYYSPEFWQTLIYFIINPIIQLLIIFISIKTGRLIQSKKQDNFSNSI